MIKSVHLMLLLIVAGSCPGRAQPDIAAGRQAPKEYYLKGSVWKNTLYAGVVGERTGGEVGYHKNNHSSNAVYTNYISVESINCGDEYILSKPKYMISAGKNRFFIMPGIWWGLKGKTYYNLEATAIHQYNQRFGVYGSITASAPKALSAGVGVRWTGKKNWTSFGVYAGADERRGVPAAALLMGHWNIWKGLFFEIEDVIVCRANKQYNLEEVKDVSGNVIGYYETENLSVRLNQQQEVFLGIAF